jgi:hypothetical protein
VRVLGRALNSAVARFPGSWRLFSDPVRRFFDSVAVSWDERVRSGSPEYLKPLVAALDHLEASPGRILDVGTGTAKDWRLVKALLSRPPGLEVFSSSSAQVARRESLRPAGRGSAAQDIRHLCGYVSELSRTRIGEGICSDIGVLKVSNF